MTTVKTINQERCPKVKKTKRKKSLTNRNDEHVSTYQERCQKAITEVLGTKMDFDYAHGEKKLGEITKNSVFSPLMTGNLQDTIVSWIGGYPNKLSRTDRQNLETQTPSVARLHEKLNLRKHEAEVREKMKTFKIRRVQTNQRSVFFKNQMSCSDTK